MNRRGFTMIELLAATALTAVLMVAVLSISASLSRTQRAIAAQPAGDRSVDTLFDLLHRDLAMATTVTVDKSDVTIETLSHVDSSEARGLTHLPSTVRYRLIRPNGDKSSPALLVRIQAERVNQAPSPPTTEVLAIGVRSFTCKKDTPRPPTDGSKAPPPRMHVRIEFQDKQRVSAEQTFDLPS